MDTFAKISTPLTGPDQPYEFENLWAEPVSGGLYLLRNVPVFAYGFSEQDIVSVVEQGGRLIVKDVVQRGGHSTYRMFLPEPVNESEFNQIWQPFGLLGCTYERGNNRTIAIDVPPSVNVRAVVDLLDQGSAQARWQFDEGYCANFH